MNRGLLSGSCSALDKVYKSTTLPVKKNDCRVKKILHLGGTARKKLEPLFNQSVSYVSTVPTDVATLENMDNIELRPYEINMPIGRRFIDENSCNHVRFRTPRGIMFVAVQGNRTKTPILTYHDIGLNHMSFQPFFNYPDMCTLLENFCVYHVTAPGQEEDAYSLPENNYVYPSMDELADLLNDVLGHFHINSFIGIGVGAGANILARFALANPQKVDALMLINCTSTQAGWIEWAYQKMNSRALRMRGFTQSVLDYLTWYHFGRFAEVRNCDLVRLYQEYFNNHVNPDNLSMFIDSYVRRSDLGISRETETLKMPVLNITSALSPHVDDTVTFNGRLHPQKTTWMKHKENPQVPQNDLIYEISDCAMVLEERPSKISQAFRLFLQGEGFVAPLSPSKIVSFRRLSEGGAPRRRAARAPRACGHSPVIRITENPISEAVVC